MLFHSVVEFMIHITLVVDGTSKICELFNILNFLLVCKDINRGLTEIPCQHNLSLLWIDRKDEHS